MKSLHEVYHAIIKDSLEMARKGPGNLDYAAAYARAGLSDPDVTDGRSLTHEAHTQALYVRTNLAGWRGTEAKAGRTLLDKLLKEYKKK